MKTNVRTLKGSLPIIAKMLGQRLGVNVEFGGNDAFTDGRTIHLPALPPDNPSVAVLANGYLDHEAAHCRFTDFLAQRGDSPFQRWVENALEDIRIETELSRMYPGCKRHLEQLTEQLVSAGVMNPVEDDADEKATMSGYILHGLRSQVLRQPAMDALADKASRRFDELFPRGTKTKLTALMGQVRQCESTQDVIDLSARIVEMLKEEQEAHSNDGESQNSEGSENGDNGQSDDKGSNQGTDSDDSDDNNGCDGSAGSDGSEEGDAGQFPDSSSESDDSVDGQDGASAGSDNDDDSAGQGGNTASDSDTDTDTDADGSGAGGQDRRDALNNALSGDESDYEKGLGEQVAEQLESNSTTEDAVDMAEPTRLDQRSDSGLIPESIDQAAVRQATARLRSRLAGLIQAQRKAVRSRSYSGKKISNQALHRVAVGDGRVFDKKRARPGVNTAVTVLLDASGSMSGREIAVAREAALATTYALEEIEGVNASAFAFPGFSRNGAMETLHRRGQRVKSHRFAINAGGGTPLAEAAWGAAWDLMQAREPRKILIVVTDGVPNDTGAAISVLERSRNSGIETVGIGIGTEIHQMLIPDSQQIDGVSGLSDALFGLLERKLVTRM